MSLSSEGFSCWEWDVNCWIHHGCGFARQRKQKCWKGQGDRVFVAALKNCWTIGSATQERKSEQQKVNAWWDWSCNNELETWWGWSIVWGRNWGNREGVVCRVDLPRRFCRWRSCGGWQDPMHKHWNRCPGVEETYGQENLKNKGPFCETVCCMWIEAIRDDGGVYRPDAKTLINNREEGNQELGRGQWYNGEVAPKTMMLKKIYFILLLLFARENSSSRWK